MVKIMCEIVGENVIDFSNAGDLYEGKTGDSCNIEDVIDQAEDLWNSSISDHLFTRPSSDDIIIITLNNPQSSFNIIWNNGEGEPDQYRNIAAVTIPTKSKILLTRPLPSSLNSIQTLAHELGHWCFDRIFEDEETEIKRLDIPYKKYSAAMAYFFEESITTNRRNCADIIPSMDMHVDGCRVLRRIEQQNRDILHNIVQEYHIRQIR